jgi:tetratricopeptide (TPR) repeat protein
MAVPNSDRPAPTGYLADPFARVVAICTVLATLLAAAVGYLDARTARATGGAKVGALELSLNSLASQVEARRAAELQYDRFAQAQRARQRAANARQERLVVGADPRAHALEERRWEWLAKETDRHSALIARAQGVSALTPRGRDGPREDPNFPTRFFARHTTFDGERLLALRDAANEQEAERGAQGSGYSVTLAMLAIAVFLFGFSLTPEGRLRGRLFAGTAIALSIAGIVNAAAAWLRDTDLASDAAAAAYARGVVALQTQEPKRAIGQFDRAIELRPTFARAYRDRATAVFTAYSPQISGYPSLTTRGALRRSNDDLRRAVQLGVKDKDVLTSLGFGLFEEGLLRRDRSLIEESVDVTRRAIAADPLNPVAQFNVGVALLALDRSSEAEEAYALAVPKLIYVDAEQQKPRDPFDQEDVLAGALTDLELLHRETGSRHAAAIKQTKEQIVGGVAAGERRIPRSSAKLSDFEVSVYSGQVSYAIHSEENFKPRRDQLSLQWYRHEPGLGWSVIPEVSGPAGEPGEDFVRDPNGGFRYEAVQYVERAPISACLQPGTYRLEAYLNGSLAGDTKIRTDHRALTPDLDRTIGVALCRPAAWRRRELPRLGGVASSWWSRDRKQGAVVLKLDRYQSGMPSPMDADALKTLDWAVRRFARLFPGRPRASEVNWNGSFAGLDTAIRRTYRLDGGRRAMLAGAGYDSEDVAWVGAVIGPASSVEPGGAGFDALLSLTLRGR